MASAICSCSMLHPNPKPLAPHPLPHLNSMCSKSACLPRVQSHRDTPSLGTLSTQKNAERAGVGKVVLANVVAFASAALGIRAGWSSLGEVSLLLGSAVTGVMGLLVLSGLKVGRGEDFILSGKHDARRLFSYCRRIVVAGAYFVVTCACFAALGFGL